MKNKTKRSPEGFGTQIAYQNVKQAMFRNKFKTGPQLVFVVSLGSHG